MHHKAGVLGTFDSVVDTLLTVDLMRCLTEVGVPPSAVVFKRSDASQNPRDAAELALAEGCIGLHVADFNSPHVVERIRGMDLDLLIYAGGKDLLRLPLLESARLGCIGGHYGWLPDVRGMGTVEWSVLEDRAPAVSVQRMTPGVDMGDVVMRALVPLFAGDNFVSIRNRSYFLTKTMLALSAKRMLQGGVRGVPQRESDGRRYFRMHPSIETRASRALLDRLAARA